MQDQSYGPCIVLASNPSSDCSFFRKGECRSSEIPNPLSDSPRKRTWGKTPPLSYVFRRYKLIIFLTDEFSSSFIGKNETKASQG